MTRAKRGEAATTVHMRLTIVMMVIGCVVRATALSVATPLQSARCLPARGPQPHGLCMHMDVESTDAAVEQAIEEARVSLQPAFTEVDRQTERTLGRVLAAFRKHGIGSEHFAGVDGYGHGDLGREALDQVFATLMGAEAALVRVQCFSGTHAIACALFGVLRPGQELLAVSGAPYDTLEEVIGLRGRSSDGLSGTLADFGISYRQVELASGGVFDLEAVAEAIGPTTRMLHVQRSCGYAWRPSICVEEIGRLAAWLNKHHPDLVLFVDNWCRS